MRFYLHFCNKYGHQPGNLGSLPLFIAKLASKGQTVKQQAQAQRDGTSEITPINDLQRRILALVKIPETIYEVLGQT